MIANALVFVCAAFGLVAGSCFEVVAPQQSAQVITIPAQTESISQLLTSGSSSGSSSIVEVVSSGSSSGSSYSEQPGNGPEATPITYVQGAPITVPAVEAPVITLSSQPIPAPRVLSQRCICTKTIVKPQVITRTVTVPKIQRYIKRTVTPVVENVSFKSTPITQGSSESPAIVIPGSSSGSASSSSSSAPVVYTSESSGSSSPVVFTSESSSVSCPRLY